jgi:hypothetical protein
MGPRRFADPESGGGWTAGPLRPLVQGLKEGAGVRLNGLPAHGRPVICAGLSRREAMAAVMNQKVILGISVADRPRHIPDVQSVLTEFGCCIKTRIGLHEVTENACSPNGTILVELHGDPNECANLEKKLRSLEGVELQKMVFNRA